MPRRPGQTRFVPNAPSVGIIAAMPVAIVGVVVPLAVVLPKLGYSFPPWYILGAIGAIIAPMFVMIAKVMRFAKRVSESDGFLCLNCHYDLHGLPDSGDCPECGEAYNRDELERRWNTWLLSQTKNQKTVRPRIEASTIQGPPRPPLRKARGPTLFYFTILPITLVPPLAILTVEVARNRWAPLWVPLTIALAVLTVAVLNARRVLRFQKQVRAADNLLCLRCHGDLRPLTAEDGDCPSCGEHYRKDGVRRRWREYLISGHLGPNQ